MPPSGSFHKKINFKLHPTVVTSSISVPDLLQAIIKSQQTTIELTNENHSNFSRVNQQGNYILRKAREMNTPQSHYRDQVSLQGTFE